MGQLICASLSHTHCWYKVCILKVPYNGILVKRTPKNCYLDRQPSTTATSHVAEGSTHMPGRRKSPFAPDNLVWRDIFGCLVPRQASARTWAFSLLPPVFRDCVHLYLQNISLVPRYQVTPLRWLSPPRVHRHRARSPQGSSNNWCCRVY